MERYLNKTIKEIHAALISGEVTPSDLVEEAIDRISRDDCNAYEATCFKEARKKAKKIGDIRVGEFLSGIPYLAKDNYSTKGVETTASSKILEGYVPLFDAEVIRKLNRSRGIMVGKTTMDELAMGGTGTTGHKGATLNPYDRERMVGGSSCGSAAAVARGDVPYALGSDTGDSVRKPAAFAGLVGFKPTWGLVSRYGLLPFACSMDTVGWFTRCVWDAAVLCQTLAGRDEKDMTTLKTSKKNYVSEVEQRHSGNRVCYFPQVVEACDPVVRDVFHGLVNKLKKEGITVEEYRFDDNLLNAIYPTYMVISCCEAASNDAMYDGMRYGPAGDEDAKTYQEFMTSARTRGFSDLIKRRFVIGSYSLLAENQHDMFQRAQRARRVIVDALNEVFKSYDYLLLPAAPSVPKRLSELSTSWSKEPDFADNHLALANLGGMPSLTVPCGFEAGLPLGVNITGRVLDDSGVLAFGQRIEDVTGLRNLTASEDR